MEYGSLRNQLFAYYFYAKLRLVMVVFATSFLIRNRRASFINGITLVRGGNFRICLYSLDLR